MALKSAKILEIIEQLGFDADEKKRTIYTMCPGCGEADKLSIMKDGGSTICYRGSCSFGGPRPFFEWVMLTAGLTRQEAIEMVYAEPVQPAKLDGLTLQLSMNLEEKKAEARDPLMPILWPLDHAHSLAAPEAEEGVKYLLSRGVPVGLAHSLGIVYSSLTRRVIFPIQMNGFVFGWQGRAIDPVAPGLRMRNNPGFQRARCVMFLDNVQLGGHAIIAEGPFDALKFSLCGGNVCTMGKVVTDDQLKAILSRSPSAIYLALDEDAATEMRELRQRVPVPLYRIAVPEHVIARCAAAGKKADFGECTLEECLEAFRAAKPFDRTTTAIYLKKPWERT